MQNRFILTLVAAAILLVSSPGAFAEEHGGAAPASGAAASKGARKIQKLRYPSLVWQIPEVGKDVRRATLDNGIVVYLMEDRELPLVELELVFRTGSLYEKKERYGVAGITASVLRTGGTKSRTPDQLNDDLEFLGAQLSSGSRMESAALSLNVLSRDFDMALEILADVLLNPAFAQEKLDFTKSQYRESLLRKNDRPAEVAGREFFKSLYGDHPYGWAGDLKWSMIESIKREEVVAWYNDRYSPRGAFIAVSGDFKGDEMLAKLNRALGAWKRDAAPKREPARPADVEKSRVLFVQKGIDQSIIYMGHLAPDRYNPDNEAIKVMNFILGGGSFNSRMMSKVRSDEGLAYSVYSAFHTDYTEGGAFWAFCQTRSEATGRAIDLMKSEIAKIQDAPVTAEELKFARESLVNQFIFNFDDTASIVSNLLYLEYDGMPADYFKTYIGKIQAVTAADVQRVAKKYLHPDRMIYLVVGDRARIGEQLRALGEVTQVQLEELE